MNPIANHREIIDDIASQADSFLAGITDAGEARRGILELLTEDYPALSATERAAIAQAVLTLLDDEGFFEGVGPGDSWADDKDDEED